MQGLTEQWFGTSNSIANGDCLSWDPTLLWLNVGSDIITGLSYYVVASILFYFVVKRGDFPFAWIFMMFGAFILSCGTVHFINAWTIFHPIYWIQALVKSASALISVLTAIVLIPMAPKLLKLPSLNKQNEEITHLNKMLQEQLAKLTLENKRRKTAEIALETNNYFLNSVLNGTTDAIYLKNSLGQYLLVNYAACQAVGKPEKDILGKTDKELFPLETSNLIHDQDAMVIKTNKPLVSVGKLHTAQGESYWRANKAPWVDENGNIEGIIGISRNITQEIESEKALVDSEERFKKAIMLSPLPSIIHAEDGEVLLINKAWEQLSGYSQAELETIDVMSEKMIKSNYQQVRKHIDTLYNLSESAEEGEFELMAKDGSKLIWDFTSTPLGLDIAGRKLVISRARDVTLRKQIEQQKIRLEAELNQAYKMEAIGTLAGGIAHDFNNVLAIIMGYSEKIKNQLNNGAELQNDVEKIYSAANRAKKLVQQILLFSQKSSVNLKLVEIRPLVELALKMIRTTLPSSINMELDLNPDTGCILADTNQIQEILMNLCTNAFDAMEQKGGTLRVSLKKITITGKDDWIQQELKEGEYVELIIKDSGSGIPKAIINKIFDPYFTTKERSKGTGMGLAIVHGIVAEYGGTISVESEPDSGSHFYLYFPSVPSNKKIESKKEIIPIARGNERILFIDDEELLCHLGQELLVSLGYQVTTKNSSSDALELFRKAPDDYDLVITDQIMPVLTGSNLSKKILQIRTDIPIILCSGFSGIIDEAGAKKLGIKAFVEKPYHRKFLAELIRKVLDEKTTS